MKKTIKKISILAVSSMALSTTSAYAQGQGSMKLNDLTVSAEAGASLYKLPQMKDVGLVNLQNDGGGYFSSQGNAGSNSFNARDVAPRISASVESKVNISGLKNPRAKIEVIYTRLNDAIASGGTCNGAYSCEPLLINGSGAPNTELAFNGDAISTQIENRTSIIEIPLKITSELGTLDSKIGKAVYEGSLGLSYIYVGQQNDINHHSSLNRDNNTSEVMTSHYFGPTTGAQINFSPSQKLSLSLGGDIGALFVHTKFNAEQKLAYNAELTNVRVKDSDNAFSLRAKILLGAKYDLGNDIVLGFLGSATYWDRVAQVIRPHADSGDDLFRPAAVGRSGLTNSSRVGYGSMISYDFGLNISVPFSLEQK